LNSTEMKGASMSQAMANGVLAAHCSAKSS